MKTENIISVFKEYLGDKTNYAILIDGSWGSGKTFFWKQELTKEIESSNLKPLYISLNGMSSTRDLESALIIKLLPLVDTSNKVFTPIKNLLSGASKKYLGSSLDEIFKGIGIDSFDFSKHVICFDDLERCQISVKEVLGFINNFVEHKGLKTIILADEGNIDRQSKGADYDSIKEKVIGRVFKYEANIDEVFKLLIQQESDSNFQKFLEQHSAYILDLLIECKLQNLRVLNYYLQGLKRLYRFIEKEDDIYIKEVLLFSFCISCEFKNGSLKSADYKDHKQLDIVSLFYAKRYILKNSLGESESEKGYIDIFYEKYLSAREEDFRFYPSVYRYILTGFLEEIEFKKEICQRYPKEDKEQDIVFKSVFTHEFRKLTEEEFGNYIAKAIEFVKDGVYEFYDYVQIADFLYFFGKNGMIQFGENDIEQLIICGLNIAIKRKNIDAHNMESILHFPKENPKVAELVQLIHNYHKEIQKEIFITQTKEFIDAVRSNSNTLLDKKFDEYNLSRDLFQYLDAEILFESIQQTANGQLDRFTRALNRRYNSINIGKFLFEDYDCLSQLNDKIKHHVEVHNVRQPRRFLLNELSKEIELILYKLKNPKD